MLDYPALAAVAAVIREGSFERAAPVLGITPSSILKRVRGLEERLDNAAVVGMHQAGQGGHRKADLGCRYTGLLPSPNECQRG